MKVMNRSREGYRRTYQTQLLLSRRPEGYCGPSDSLVRSVTVVVANGHIGEVESKTESMRSHGDLKRP